MPENSSNYLSKFAPKSHFFTQPAAITQTSAQAFGPVSEQEFRLTSSFNIAANTPAFAICTGIVFIQPQASSSDKVNLVLRPYKQPIPGINIRYFVYRGLNIADFFDGNKVKAASGTTSGFINKINADFASFHTTTDANTPVPDFLAQYIGYDPANQAGTLPLDDFFFKSTADEAAGFELPLIGAGQTLGTFKGGTGGIEVVLNYGDYKLPLAETEYVFNLTYARAAETTITVAAEADAFKKKVRREQIYQFLDVAAYYGFHQAANGTVLLPDNIKLTGAAIYNQLVSKFHTRNKLYLYIQSDRGRSYNFYGNYAIPNEPAKSLKIGDTSDPLTTEAFATNGWPLIIREVVPNTDTQSHLYLQLVTDKNVNAALFGAVAQLENAQRNNFIDADNLPNGANPADGFTKTLILANPATIQNGQRVSVATFNQLLYQVKTYTYQAGTYTDEEGEPVAIQLQPNFFDDVFDLIQATPLQVGETNYSAVTSQRLKLVNHYFNKKQQGISAVQTLNVADVLETGFETPGIIKRVTYVTETIDLLHDATSGTGSLSSSTQSTPAFGGMAGNSTYQLPQPYYYIIKSFTAHDVSVRGLLLKTSDNSLPTKIILGLTQPENQLLIDLITTNQVSNARLFLLDLFDSDKGLVSPENIPYQKYKVGISGENTGKLNLYLPATDVLVYSLDRFFHFSKGYSQYMPELPFNDLYIFTNLAI